MADNLTNVGIVMEQGGDIQRIKETGYVKYDLQTSSTAIAFTATGVKTFGSTTTTEYTLEAPPSTGCVAFDVLCTVAGATNTQTIRCSTGVTFDGTNRLLRFVAPSAARVFNVSATRWGVLKGSTVGVTIAST